MNNNIFEACMNEHNKLDGSNYANWKFKMQTQIKEQSAWMIVNGDEPKPTAGSASVLDWEKQESRARTMLKMSVKYCIILHIREGKSANEIGNSEGIVQDQKFKSSFVPQE